MDILRCGDAGFDAAWSGFASSAQGSWRLLPVRLEHERLCSGERLIRDVSFLLVEPGAVLAACQLWVERSADGPVLTNRGWYCSGPYVDGELTQGRRDDVWRRAMQEIDELAREHGVVKCMLQLDPVAAPAGYNVLVRYGFLDSGSHTAVLDLSPDREILWKGLRKSYKALINKGRKVYRLEISDARRPDRAAFDAYVALHHKTAGRITRPLETFELQYQKILDDNAMLVSLFSEGRYAAFSYFIHHQNFACYGSSSDDPDMSLSVPIEHCIIWEAAEYYKNRGILALEIGHQPFGPQLFEIPSDKELSIAFFKRGFGGAVVPHYRGIKFYDRDVMRRELVAALEAYLTACRPGPDSVA